MQKIFTINGLAATLNNGAKIVGHTSVEPSDYKLILLEGNATVKLRGFNPTVTSGKFGTSDLSQTSLTKLNSTGSYYIYNSAYNKPLTLVFTNVSVNTLSFTFRSEDSEELHISYVLYRTVDGTDTQISSGTLPYVLQYTDVTLNLT